LRTATSILGVALAVAILVASLWSFGSIERMIHVTFGLAERQDVRLVLTAPRPAQALGDIRHLPGVLIAEPFRLVAARLSNGTRSRRLAIEGRPATAGLSRALSPDLQPMPPPQDGLILTEALASALDLHPGDRVHVAFLEGHRSVVDLPVSGLSLGYVGLGATMEIDALRRATGDPDLVSGANIRLDPAAMGAFLNSAAEAPQIGFLNLTDLTVTRFRDTIAQNIVLMVTVYVTLAAIIAVGMVFNFSRITLSEQGRDLASLRVMGFSPNEVAGVILTELAVVVALAQPLGWGLGYLMGRAMAAAFSSDLYRVPFVMGPEVHATASLAVIAAAAVSVPAIRRRINRLDLIAVLKTRE
jgi:putative ABC transport system permease protein